ncbi:hypothetical protein LZ32DRAFT_319498 [Colletotrichum eremochloae]|nr:hypothetical protein LZ32DRAFT_319498 [Colletotrichum eremochloae]
MSIMAEEYLAGEEANVIAMPPEGRKEQALVLFHVSRFPLQPSRRHCPVMVWRWPLPAPKSSQRKRGTIRLTSNLRWNERGDERGRLNYWVLLLPPSVSMCEALTSRLVRGSLCSI